MRSNFKPVDLSFLLGVDVLNNRVPFARHTDFVTVFNGSLNFTQQIKHRALATLVICRGTLGCSKTLLRWCKPSIGSVPRMPAFAELHNENKVDEPAMKAQKVDIISTLQVKLLSAAATLPRRGSPKAAGYDLARSVKGEYVLAYADRLSEFSLNERYDTAVQLTVRYLQEEKQSSQLI